MSANQPSLETADQRPRLPVGVRLVAAFVALLAIGGGIFIGLLTLLFSMPFGRPSDVTAGQLIVPTVMGVATAAVGLVIARGVWAGSGWARLTTQINFAIWGLSAVAGALNPPSYPNPPAVMQPLFLLAAAVVLIAVTVYLERPGVRAGFGLEPVGVAGRLWTLLAKPSQN